jgi:hypothetical protein
MTTIYIANQDGYIFVNGKLTAYKFNSAKIDFANGMVEYSCILGGEETSFKTDERIKVYASEEHFRQGICENNLEQTYASAIRSAFFYVRDNVNQNPQFPAFQIQDGEVVECNLPMDNFLYDSNYRIKYVGEGKYYECRNEALLHCDIIKVDEQGEETIIPSPATLLSLDAEQMDALKAVQDALKKANELGVKFILDNDGGSFFAYSDKYVKERTWDCFCSGNGEDKNHINDYGVLLNDLATPVGYNIPSFSMCDTGMYVKFEK